MSQVVPNTLSLHQLDVLSNDSAHWDAFVAQCSVASFFHLTGWGRIAQRVFGHRCHYLYAKREGNIVGVLPLVEQKSALFGHALISTPFCVYGGAASDDESVLLFLEDAAIGQAEALGVDYLELRYPFSRDNPRLTEKCAHSTFGFELADSSEAILAGVKKKQRAVIRHSLKNGLNFRVDQDAQTAYRIYSESVRNLGTPVFDKAYFQALVDEFGDACDVLTVEKAGEAVSSVLSFYFKDQVLPYYGGGLHKARALKSNDFMYYQLMCAAKSQRNCGYFDFGRSKNDSGAYHYKKSFGIAPKALHYQYYLVKAEGLPNLSPNNPKYRLFIAMWKRLPLWLSNALGPSLSKYLG